MSILTLSPAGRGKGEGAVFLDNKMLHWNFYSIIIIIIYALLQAIRWPILPQSMDIYYHLATAWGFNQAGGYSGWDFWQYAPIGRPHIYPPLFHLILAFLMKLKISVIILAKFCETIAPIAFLLTLWLFIRKHFGERIAFFVVLAFSSSFDFYMSLINHLPATLGLILGTLTLSSLGRGKGEGMRSQGLSPPELKLRIARGTVPKRLLLSSLFLTLSFYTHIGVSWFFAASIFIYGLLDKQFTKMAFKVIILSLILSSPILFKEIYGIRFISGLGFKMGESRTYQIHILFYLFALFGLALTFAKEKKYRIFAGIFLASLIFLLYPYRFFSAEGYLAVILLSAVFFDYIYAVIAIRRRRITSLRGRSPKQSKFYFIASIIFISLISPGVRTIPESSLRGQSPKQSKFNFFDSAFLGMLSAKGNSIWFPKDYLPASRIIKDNSSPNDIIYSPLNLAGVILSAISGRATANALLPEIQPTVSTEPYAASKIIIFNRLDEDSITGNIINKYGLKRIGETKTFILYINSRCLEKINRKRASIPFWVIIPFGSAMGMFLFFSSMRGMK